MTQDEKYILKCIEISKSSLEKGDAPFGSIIVKENEIIAESDNNASEKVSDHAEILVLDKAHKKLGTSDLSGCTLYSNCEPCPMCSFMIREYKISRVVFALPSKYMGGHSRWPILDDEKLSKCEPFFSSPPEVVGGILEKEAKAVYEKTILEPFFGSDININ